MKNVSRFGAYLLGISFGFAFGLSLPWFITSIMDHGGIRMVLSVASIVTLVILVVVAGLKIKQRQEPEITH